MSHLTLFEDGDLVCDCPVPHSIVVLALSGRVVQARVITADADPDRDLEAARAAGGAAWFIACPQCGHVPTSGPLP